MRDTEQVHTFTNQDGQVVLDVLWACFGLAHSVALLITSFAFCAGGPSSWRAVDEECS